MPCAINQKTYALKTVRRRPPCLGFVCLFVCLFFICFFNLFVCFVEKDLCPIFTSNATCLQGQVVIFELVRVLAQMLILVAQVLESIL